MMKPTGTKMPPIKRRKAGHSPASATTNKQIMLRDPLEIKKIAKQSDMLRDMKNKFTSIEKQLKKDPNFDISDKDIELLRSYVVASMLKILITTLFIATQPMQSIKLLKVQAKEREAAQRYEEELERIIQRAEVVDKTTKDYTEEQKKTIAVIDEKDAQLKESAKIYESNDITT